LSPRLKAVALLPFQNVPEAVKELRRAVTELGMSGAFAPAVGLRLPLGHPEFHPIYAEAERLGLDGGVTRHRARAAVLRGEQASTSSSRSTRSRIRWPR